MSAVKALQQWCKIRCEGYRDVNITNMTTSFRDGLAFCALIHIHRPDLINFDSLKKDNVYENNKLAFRVAEDELGIPALLDAEDMVALKIPDRLSILTYVSQYYNYFHGRSPIGGMAGVKRPSEGSTEEPSGKKNQPVVSKVFPSSKPATENCPPRPSPSLNPVPTPVRPPQTASISTKDVSVEKSNPAGTLNNKCVSCHKHVHLVQRHLVDGKLYHRSCAKSNTPLRDLPSNTLVSKYAPESQPSRANTTSPNPAPSKLGPSWLSSTRDRSIAPVTISTTISTSSPRQSDLSFSPSSRGRETAPNPTPTPTATVTKPTAAPRAMYSSTFTTTVVTTPAAASRTSTTAEKTQQAKLNFPQNGNIGTAAGADDKTPVKKLNTSRGLNVNYQGQGLKGDPHVNVVVSVTDVGNKEVYVKGGSGGNRVIAVDLGGGHGKAGSKGENSSSSKTQAAAAFISKKLSKESNNNEIKPAWTNVALRKTDKPEPEPPKKVSEGAKVRVKLKANPSLLADLQMPSITPSPTPTPTSRSGLAARAPDIGSSKPTSTASFNILETSESSHSPTEWRSMLKPVSKETKPVGPKQASPVLSNRKEMGSPSKPQATGEGKSQISEPKPGPSSTHLPSHRDSSSGSGPTGSLNGKSSPTANGVQPELKTSKTKPDYIPKERILQELQGIEDNLNDLEGRGVDLELRLRHCEEEGQEDTNMDELMVEWFNLIRNKQVAIRRESELVYIARTQDLEEQQPSVEQELRGLLEKPEHLKTTRDRRREEELMAKLVGIVNDRNAIVDGLDEDRLREEEEDEQLNKMMQNFDMKKDKTKKKSPMSKLFKWGNKKEG
ncbi:MICAL-like protein 2 [Lampris incognitus]|uniref:MICAL-like protein 2 n=1 Tax=Lampris incognitus TaxID=2546036 RepID=UPI0024B58C79|nr:MICAL-like protein 2 [Lampris incognitus]